MNTIEAITEILKREGVEYLPCFPTTPVIEAKKPIVKPVKKKDFVIDLLLKPKVLKIAISLVLFLIKIVRPEIILKAATTIINVSIINIIFLSNFNAAKNDLFRSDHE